MQHVNTDILTLEHEKNKWLVMRNGQDNISIIVDSSLSRPSYSINNFRRDYRDVEVEYAWKAEWLV